MRTFEQAKERASMLKISLSTEIPEFVDWSVQVWDDPDPDIGWAAQEVILDASLVCGNPRHVVEGYLYHWERYPSGTVYESDPLAGIALEDIRRQFVAEVERCRSEWSISKRSSYVPFTRKPRDEWGI